MFKELANKNKKIAVVGLGYVGLPLIKLLSKKFDVIGFDVDKNKIDSYKQGIDVTCSSEEDPLSDYDIEFTSDETKLSEANFIIVTVPTPVKQNQVPDLSYVESATETVAKNLKPNSIIVYESTVYPGVTEEVCVPIIERISGFKCGEDFCVGYSPERVNPGKNNEKLENINKIVSGMNKKSLDIIYNVYDSILNADVYKAQTIKVAEAAKVTENIQRDVNIALINELSIIYNNMGIKTQDVIDAAGTKWNFVKYTPGLVGGHCIGIDPYYLIYKSQLMGYNPRLINESRNVNENMIEYIFNNIVLSLIKNKVEVKNSEVLLCGVTFKENCNDLRNSKIIEVIEKLKELDVNITIYDPNITNKELKDMYGLELTETLTGKYDAIVIATPHSQFKEFTYEQLKDLSKNKLICIDLKEILRDKLENNEDVSYWSL